MWFAPWLFITLSGAGELHGQVVDAADLPVSGVVVLAYNQRFGYSYVYSEADGSFAFTDLPPNWYRLRVLPLENQVWAEQWSQDTLSVCEAEQWQVGADTVAHSAFTLREGARISGVLTDTEGTPVAGAMVTAVWADGSQRSQSRMAVSDGTGVFQIVGIADEGDGLANWWLEVESTSQPTQFYGSSYDRETSLALEVESLASVELEEDWTLLAGINVQGTVTGPSGSLVSGDVHVYSPSQVKSAVVSMDGTYSVSGLPPGAALAWYYGDGHAVTYFPDSDRPSARLEQWEEGGELDNMNLDVPVERLLRGVLKGDGDLSSASVLALNDERTVGFGAPVNADGSFAIEKLHPGEYILQVRAASLGYLNEEILDADGEPRWFTVSEENDEPAVEIELSPGAAVFGHVRDPSTGLPVYGTTVAVMDEEGVQRLSTTTEMNGEYRLEGIRPGSWQLVAVYEAYCPEDPSWVRTYFPDSPAAAFGTMLELSGGQELEWNVDLGPDMDRDFMDDLWEALHGLDTTVDDSQLDPDQDGQTNLEEYLAGSNPNEAPLSGCACSSSSHRGLGWVWFVGALLIVGSLRRRGFGCKSTNGHTAAYLRSR